MANGARYVAARIRPTSLLALEPAVIDAESLPDDAPAPSPFFGCTTTTENTSALTDAVQRLLQASAVAYGRWFTVVRECIRRDRIRQQLFREEHDLPKTARLPYEQQPLTAAEHVTVQTSESLIRALYGDLPADYAQEKFQRALSTGDLRAFKIRLLLLKVRDSIQESPLYPDFLNGLEDCISRAEALAGCRPDSSPRRLSRIEQEKKRLREEKEARIRAQQPELNLQWEKDTTERYPTIQDIEVSKKENQTPETTSVDNSEAARIDSSTEEFKILKKAKNRKKRDFRNSNKKHNISTTSNNKDTNSSVTVTNDDVTMGVTVTLKSSKHTKRIVRKTREYETVEQILEDIENGKIVPYESSEEICADLKAEKLTPTEAFMFTMALDRCIPEATEGIDPESAMEMERDRVDEEDGEPEDRNELNEEESEVDEERNRNRGGVSFSYNPRGFGGCGGHYSDAGTDWNTDDE